MAESSVQERKELIRAYFAAWNAGNPEEIATFFADDFLPSYTDWVGDEVRIDPEDVHDWFAGWLDIISEMTHKVHKLVAEANQVVVHVTYRGVHDGRLFGIESTGKTVGVEEYLYFRVENDEIVEFDWLGDDLALVRQLGVELPFEK